MSCSTEILLCFKFYSGNNFAKGYYTDGRELLDSVLDTLQRETEACDFVSGYQLVHGLGGGTGSGLGSLLLEKMHDLYPKKLITTYSVFPSARVSLYSFFKLFSRF